MTFGSSSFSGLISPRCPVRTSDLVKISEIILIKQIFLRGDDMKVVFGILGWLCCGLGVAQNFVSNGSFDQNIDQWDDTSATVRWVADDGLAALGALEISDNFNNGGSATTAHVPIEVQQGKTYELSAAVKVMPDTEAQGAVMIIQWLNSEQRHVGFNDYVYSNPNISDGTWHTISDRFTPPQDMAYALIFLGVTGSSNGSSDFAIARWDDVRFSEVGATGFAILPAHSGSWYDPGQSGHGLNVEILDNNRAQIYWYTYDHQGNNLWLIGSGTHNGQEIMVDAATTNGAMFPPAFDPDDVNLTLWGQFYLRFTGCHSAVFKWTPKPNSTYTGGEMTVTRLTQLKGHSCAE